MKHFITLTFLAATATSTTAALGCTNGNGGNVFDDSPINLCFPNKVTELPWDGYEEFRTFLGSVKPENMLIFALLSKTSNAIDNYLSQEELEVIARLFFQDASSVSVTPLDIKKIHSNSLSTVQISWPAYGTHHGVNCVIYANDINRLIYCGAVKDDQALPGSVDLFVPEAEAVVF